MRFEKNPALRSYASTWRSGA